MYMYSEEYDANSTAHRLKGPKFNSQTLRGPGVSFQLLAGHFLTLGRKLCACIITCYVDVKYLCYRGIHMYRVQYKFPILQELLILNMLASRDKTQFSSTCIVTVLSVISSTCWTYNTKYMGLGVSISARPFSKAAWHITVQRCM